MVVPRVLILLAQGFEEIEAITIIDVLRRADVEVITAGLAEGPLEASRRTRHLPDTTLDQLADGLFDAVVLPGGVAGTQHLKGDPRVRECLRRHEAAGRWIAAICAAPLVLQEAGLTAGRRLTSHPSVRDQFSDAHYLEDRVVVDGRLVTSRGAGTAMEFSFKLVELLCGSNRVEEINRGILARV